MRDRKRTQRAPCSYMSYETFNDSVGNLSVRTKVGLQIGNRQSQIANPMKLSLQLGKFNFSFASARSAISPSAATRLSPTQAWMRGEDWPGTHTLTSPYEQSVWGYTAVSALAQTVPAIP